MHTYVQTRHGKKEQKCPNSHDTVQYGNRVVEFSSGGTKLEIFLNKNQHTERKLLNFEFWINGELSNVPKFDFQNKFSKSKII